MEEIKNNPAENEPAAPEEKEPEEMTDEEKLEKAKENLQRTLLDGIEKQRAMLQEANEAIKEGKGRLKLETPIREHQELVFDFTVLKGIEYTDAMDSDPNASNAFNITRRQALALFAKAAAKQTPGLDMQDIIAEIGVTDSVEGVQLATLFFNASTRAGRMRISKK